MTTSRMDARMVELAVIISWVLGSAILLGLIVFAIMRMRQNREMIMAGANKEIVAGTDAIEGQSETMPEQFEEPDDEVLDVMQQLLDDAAPDDEPLA